ncbi:hypothetical protein [Microseira wollei]|uniref:Uncharacterized protein n=1 Tax=Microseira wollei NIES-4236 TaxID=2530354 RepID=A0AAV3X0T3_9CYAN|nr:hypothetical protein [Microseira wollei]GET35375.1 hypothetical protein MiSe_01170 [Microseira wollei NIES-4236]
MPTPQEVVGELSKAGRMPTPQAVVAELSQAGQFVVGASAPVPLPQWSEAFFLQSILSLPGWMSDR